MGVDLMRALAKAPAFGRIDRAALRSILPLLVQVSLKSGETLVSQGEEDSDLYVVLKGKLTITEERDGTERELNTVGAGSIVGEISSIAGGRRMATVRARVASEVARLPAAALEDLFSRFPDVAARMAEEAQERLLWSHFLEIAGRVFGEVGDEVIREVFPSVKWIHINAGEILFSEGDPADAAYVVVLGRLRLSTSGGIELNEVGRGELIGASTLLEGGVRKATAFAARDTYLVRIPRSAVERIAEHHPQAALQVSRNLLAGMKLPLARRHASDHLSVALVGGSDGIDLRMFASRLVDSVSKYGSVHHIWSAKADSALHKAGISQTTEDGLAQVALTRWLFEQEDQHQIVIYEADPSWSAWTQLALRQADRVLVVVDPQKAPRRGVAEQLGTFLPELGRPRVSLVLSHPPGTEKPRGSAAWLDWLGADEHYHVRADSNGDFDRLARVIGGHAIALVLGGGGARGFAHLGAIQALNECHIPIDFVAGASIGAIMAAIPAMETAPEEMIELAARGFAHVIDHTLPLTSVLKGKKSTKSLLSQFGDLQIEDMWLPYFCVTTNLTRNIANFQRSGPIVRALRAGTAIPGVFPPVAIDGEVHIDGGVMNNLPADEMRRWQPQATIIAVDVAPPLGPAAKTDYGLWLSGWSAAWERLRRNKKKRLPGIADTLMRATVAASTQERRRMVEEGVTDLYLSLDLRGVGFLDFDNVERIASRGYEQTMPQLREWLERNTSADKKEVGAGVAAHTT